MSGSLASRSTPILSGASHYDTRATFVTLAVEDGANAQIIRDRVTHTKPRRNGFDFYDRGDHWIETCREVAKLKIVRTRDPRAF